MKEATGELNMTVITVVIIAALAAVAAAVVIPAISTGIRNNTCKTMLDTEGTGQAYGVKNDNVWYCCTSKTYAADKCVKLED